MCFSKIPNASTARPTHTAGAALSNDHRLAVPETNVYASLWSSRRVRAAKSVQNTGVPQRR